MKICPTVLSYGADTKIVKTQRARTPKVAKLELRFMCSARRPMVLNVCMSFHENMSSGFKIMKRTRKLLTQKKGNNSKSRKTRGTVHVFCTSSHCV